MWSYAPPPVLLNCQVTLGTRNSRTSTLGSLLAGGTGSGTATQRLMKESAGFKQATAADASAAAVGGDKADSAGGGADSAVTEVVETGAKAAGDDADNATASTSEGAAGGGGIVEGGVGGAAAQAGAAEGDHQEIYGDIHDDDAGHVSTAYDAGKASISSGSGAEVASSAGSGAKAAGTTTTATTAGGVKLRGAGSI